MFQIVSHVTFQTVLIVFQPINVHHVLLDLISQLQTQMFVFQLVTFQTVSNVLKEMPTLVQLVNQDFNLNPMVLFVNQFRSLVVLAVLTAVVFTIG